MAEVTPSLERPLDNEKNITIYEAEPRRGSILNGSVEIEKKDVSSSDGDDGLKLAGTHAQDFDDKYMSSVRRKIVSRKVQERQ